MMRFERFTVEEAKAGIACGPVSGSDDIEMVISIDGKEVFLHLSHIDVAFQLRVADESLVELNEKYWSSKDSEAVLDELDQLTNQIFDWSVDDVTEYFAACKTEYGKAVELLTAVMWKYIAEYDEEWIEELQESIAGKEFEEIEIPAFPIAWDEEYADEEIYAHDLRIEETDDSGYVDVVMAECIVEDKIIGKTVYVYIDTMGDEQYNFWVADESMMDEILESGEAIPPAAVADRVSESYGPELEDAKGSKYYEVFRRLVYSIEN